MSVLVCVLPARGHVSPTLAVVAELVGVGHTVHVVTGRHYRDSFLRSGATVTMLEPDADFDDDDLDASFPGRSGLTGLRLARHDLIEAFVRPIPARWETLRRILDERTPDLVLLDPLFLAGIPLLLTRTTPRPRVMILGFLPVTLPPITPPGPMHWLREPLTRFGMHQALATVQRLAEQITHDVTGQRLDCWFADWVGLSDGILQMTCPGFEYPRAHTPTPIQFVGTQSTSTRHDHPLPEWWADLETAAPIIHLTQGTVANADRSAVIRPALDALADRNCLIVISTGGQDVPGPLPANARAAAYLPYDELLPRCALMITNGGYGGVNLALRHAVPLLVVGATEDKRAVAQRVTWSKTGIGIGRATTSPDRIARAVDHLLGDHTFKERAHEIATQMAACPTISQTL